MSQLFPGPGPSFDDPLGMLRACHDRILRQCDTLTRLAEHLAKQGLDEAGRTAATQVHKYFSTAGQHHHEDEEQDLFPALQKSGQDFSALIARLHADHAEMATAWAALEPLLVEPARIGDVPAFADRVARFRALYEGHIAVENGELLPQAADALSPEQRREIGARMMRRRGVTPE